MNANLVKIQMSSFPACRQIGHSLRKMAVEQYRIWGWEVGRKILISATFWLMSREHIICSFGVSSRGF